MADADIALRLTKRTIDGPVEAFTHGFSETLGRALAWAMLVVFIAWIADTGPFDDASEPVKAAATITQE